MLPLTLLELVTFLIQIKSVQIPSRHAGCPFLVEFLQTRQSTFKISCQIAVIPDTDTQQNVILNTFLKIIIPLAEINQAV